MVASAELGDFSWLTCPEGIGGCPEIRDAAKKIAQDTVNASLKNATIAEVARQAMAGVQDPCAQGVSWGCVRQWSRDVSIQAMPFVASVLVGVGVHFYRQALARINGLQGITGTLQQQIAAQAGTINGLQGITTALQQQIAGDTQQLAAQGATMAQLTARVSGLQEAVRLATEALQVCVPPHRRG